MLVVIGASLAGLVVAGSHKAVPVRVGLSADSSDVSGFRLATWNMQGGSTSLDSKWSTGVTRLTQNHGIVALQEAGPTPPGGQHMRNITSFPQDGMNVTLSEWNVQTADRPVRASCTLWKPTPTGTA